MNFVLTGHKGLIGTSLLRRLKEQGHKPVLLIDKRDGTDIARIDELKITEPADMMIHLASFCKINKTIENPELAFENNVLGTYKILEFCRKNKIPKIIFTSSSRILENEKNPYTASKIYGEELCKAYCQCYNIDYIIIRLSTVYGPFNDITSRLVDIFIRNAMKNEKLKIFGDETKTLDFTYVDDFVSGFLLAMKQKNKEYDIGSGKATSISHVADFIIKQIGKGEKVFEEAEIAQPQHVEVDITEMQKLGYEPANSIEQGLQKTIDWYQKNISKDDL